MTDSPDYIRLVNSRKVLRTQVTALHNTISTFNELSCTQKSMVKVKLNKYDRDLNDVNAKLQNLIYDETRNENELLKDIQLSQQYGDKIQECIAVLDEHLQSRGSDRNNEVAKSLLRSPVAPLPEFSGGFNEDYNKFIKSFEETTSKFKYTDYDRFLLLKQQLKGKALILINSLETTSESYSNAVRLLNEAFACPINQKYNVIKKISQMKLSLSDDPFNYISQMRSLIASVNSLEIDVNSFLIYFFWSGLNDEFKTQVTHITNKSKPSLDELNDNFFKANERYQNVLSCKKKNKFETQELPVNKAASLAVNVNSPDSKVNRVIECVLCKSDKHDASHPIFKCPVYVNSKDKLSKLTELKGCTKCANLNHSESSCNFKFKIKCNCKKWHFKYLCSQNPKSPKKDKVEPVDTKSNEPKKAESTACTVYVTDAFPNYHGSNSILPTFTGNLNGMKVRCLKDQCCQSNFITDEIANSLNLVTIQDDVVLNVVGFNGPCEYNTRVVELNLDCGDQVRTLNAICVPEIKISLDIPNLSDIVKSFVSRGYKLADENLSSSTNKINNIGFVLGAKSAYCLRATEVTFGLDQSSVYAETNLGIVLLGDGPSIINNAMYLPNLNKPNENVFAVSLNELEINNDFDICNSIKSRSDIVNEIESNDNFSIFNYNVNDLNEQSNLSKFENPEGFEISAIDFNENIDRKLLNKATEQMLDLEYKQINYVENCKDDDVTSEQNFKLIQYVLDNTTRDKDGRLVMPLLWRNEVAHLLGKNFQLAKNILISNFNKLKNKPNHLKLMNESFKEQIKSGILSPISNLDSFLIENPNYSFLPHMGVFKLNRETTKCRVVYLSNLCQLDKTKPMTVSHNQAIHSGPCLNSKISIALINLRFDKKILIFDLQKAFNQILLSDNDSSRLLSLWFKDVENGDYSIVAYRNVRLMFGLRCSPTILMLGLYKLLVQDSINDCPETRKLKLLIYNNFYMDNGAITASSTDILIKFYKILDSIFNPYGFLIQQLISNDFAVQQIIDPTCEKLSSETKLLGTLWNCSEDTLFTQPISLDKEANTKRKILASIASQYDLNNFNGPILNRSRVFMHSLQCCKELGWDDPLSKDKLKEWRNIVVQANSSPPIKVPRCIGSRSDEYRLIVFTDTSKVMYGVVIYILNLTLNKISFLMAKNRIVSSKLQNKSIPALELQAVLLGTQCLIELYQDLSGPCCTVPVNISSLELYCDSMVSLSWLDADVNKLAKTQKRTVFVQNRIDEIKRLCEIKPVTFRFISGSENPADYISRCVSYKQLVKTNYMTGPLVETLIDPDKTDTLSVCIPNPKINDVDKVLGFSTQVVLDNVSPLFNFNDVSSFSKIITKYKNVLSFIYKLKARVKERTNLFRDFDSNSDPYIDSISKLIKVEQQKYFPDIFEFFVSKKPISETPNLVSQLNVFKDEDGILLLCYLKILG